jgi:hypothetical protein
LISACEKATRNQQGIVIQDTISVYFIQVISKTLSELRIICRGKRLTLNERILPAWLLPQEQGTSQAQPTILDVLLKSWFIVPLKSKAGRKGTLHEPFNLANFPAF